MGIPVLYSFRRCPYCMRAHMALKYAGLKAELREVDLKALPPELVTFSESNTVPVLHLSDGNIIDESWDIMKWALTQNDPDNWSGENKRHLFDAEMLVESNDFSFKDDLDHYKYANRFPQQTQQHYREACEEFIVELEQRLTENKYLFADQQTVADIAVFPFIRQFSLVNKEWFDQTPYVNVQLWLNTLIASELFQHIFQKQDLWREGVASVYI